MTTQNKIITGFVVVILLIVGGYYFTHQGTKSAIVSGTGEPTGFDNINLTGSLRTGVAAGDVAVTGNGNGSITASGSIFTTGGISASSTLTVQNNIVSSNVNSTSTTATTQTLVASDIVGYSTISITLNVAADSITLPASSTLATWLPNSGDNTSFVIYNATTTANKAITLVAGTGTLLESASSTNVIISSRGATVDVFRKPNSDFIFMLNPAI